MTIVLHNTWHCSSSCVPQPVPINAIPAAVPELHALLVAFGLLFRIACQQPLPLQVGEAGSGDLQPLQVSVEKTKLTVNSEWLQQLQVRCPAQMDHLPIACPDASAVKA